MLYILSSFKSHTTGLGMLALRSGPPQTVTFLEQKSDSLRRSMLKALAVLQGI